MGPRPFGRGRASTTAPSTRPAKLQWGRDLSVAEGRGPTEKSPQKRGASMGPRPFGRGRLITTRRAPEPCHGFNGAATFRSRKDVGAIRLATQKVLGFNGAATFRSRKGRRVPQGGKRKGSASMGPRPFGRGRYTLNQWRVAMSKASMGPRPFGRGRPPGGYKHSELRMKLQWGRDLSVAEGPIP